MNCISCTREHAYEVSTMWVRGRSGQLPDVQRTAGVTVTATSTPHYVIPSAETRGTGDAAAAGRRGEQVARHTTGRAPCTYAGCSVLLIPWRHYASWSTHHHRARYLIRPLLDHRMDASNDRFDVGGSDCRWHRH